jgi:hypothetical protein
MHPDGREHRARPDDPCPDGGSDELDLAVNPVPVTPPTWRRAAWLAVGSSCAVLTVLVFTAAGFAERPFDRTDAFPGLPTGGLLTVQPLGPPGHPSAATADPGSGGSAMPGDPTGASTDGTAGSGSAGSERDGTHSTGTWPATPTGRQSRGGPASPPVVSVKPTTSRPPPVPAEDLINATVAFYDLLPMDVDLAWDMVGPKVKSRGYDSFRRQWGDAREVQLRQVVVDADDSSVLATVRLVAADGTEYVQRFELDLRKRNSLIIDEIVLVSDEGRKPAR